jgi:hypothetical protein
MGLLFYREFAHDIRLSWQGPTFDTDIEIIYFLSYFLYFGGLQFLHVHHALVGASESPWLRSYEHFNKNTKIAVDRSGKLKCFRNLTFQVTEKILP